MWQQVILPPITKATASFVVDATGRKSHFATQEGVSKIRGDNLAGVFRFYQFEKDR